MGGLLRRDVDHPGPSEWIQMGERPFRHGRAQMLVAAPPRAAAQPPIWLIDRLGRMNCTWPISWPAHFPRHAACHEGRQLVVVRAAAHRAPQVGLLEGEQAAAEIAVGGEAHTVAGLAERTGHRWDHAHVPGAVEVAEPLGRRCPRRRPARSGTRHRSAATISSWDTTDVPLQRPSASSGMNSMKRTSTPCSRPKRAKSTTSSSLTPRTPRVDLDRLEAGPMGGLDPGEDALELVAARQLGEAVGAQASRARC